jgi:hypothetical protein
MPLDSMMSTSTDQVSGWAGGGLSLTNLGVSESGDIRVAIVGNCPKCGFEYGKGLGASIQQTDAPNKELQKLPTDRASYYKPVAAKATERDIDALARTSMAETWGKGRDTSDPEYRKAAAAVQLAAMNRARAQNKSPYESIVGESGSFGKQEGNRRPFATSFDPEARTLRGNKVGQEGINQYNKQRELAKELLEGKGPDPGIGKSTLFHSTDMKNKPKFAEYSDYVNTVGGHAFYQANPKKEKAWKESHAKK